ncbi:NAD(P)-dependent oxidoreductase [Kineococcus sp. LSe6-4]|uniref:NAD(P)-dependent oxidoreductase n=1 Tax=Kineococcus halophytocola TaxID=3234027 RepID=A0ABV4H4F8_9ACTN
MSTVIVFGATGYAGGRITTELLDRGHRVTGVARNRGALDERATFAQGSIHDADFVRETTRGADHVVVALPAAAPEAGSPGLIDALPLLTDVATTEGARLSFVGGAGSLQVGEGGPTVVSQPDFNPEYRPEALAHSEILQSLRAGGPDLDWFYLSPAAEFGAWVPGERTGTFRLGGDVLLTDAEGGSTISGDDYAIAYVDEIESGAHPRRRFTVAY